LTRECEEHTQSNFVRRLLWLRHKWRMDNQ